MSSNIDLNALDSLGLAPRTPDKPRDRLGQEDFLALMISQLRNQDPFKPMESGEFLGQLAQFGTVTGISDMQQSLEALTGALRSNQTLQAAALVGRDVLVPSHEGWLPPEASLRGRVEVAPGATDLMVGIYDLHGRLVARQPVQSSDGVTAEFEWDGTLADGGRAAPGFYELRASAGIQGQEVALGVLVAGRVESVATGRTDGALALTVTGLGVVDFRDVRGIS